MYLSIANHLGLHISEPLYKKLVGHSACQCQLVVLRGAQAVGLCPHLSNLIYIYKSKITIICTWSIAPYTRNRKVVVHHQGPMKVISGLLPETWGYFCMKNLISCLPIQKFPPLSGEPNPSTEFLVYL